MGLTRTSIGSRQECYILLVRTLLNIYGRLVNVNGEQSYTEDNKLKGLIPTHKSYNEDYYNGE